MKKTLIVAAVLSGSLVRAQSQDTASKPLNEVVVTANKFPQKQSNTGKVLTVINREQLQKSAGRSLAELLNIQSGIIIGGAQNILGTNLDVFVRGAGSGKTLILIDGIPVYDPSSTNPVFDLNLMAVDQLERVEILKGSQSTLYGSDAVAGVINLITKKGTGKPVNAFASLAAGSYDTYKASAGANGKTGNTGYNVQYTKVKSNGFSTAYDQKNTGWFDKDGFDQDAGVANWMNQSGSHLKLRASGQYSHNKTDLDAGAFTDEKDYTFRSKNALMGAGADYTAGNTALHFNYSYNTLKRTFTDDSASVGGFSKYSKGVYEGQSHYAEVYGNISLHKHIELLAGIDFRNQLTEQNYLSVSAFGPYKTALSDDSAQLKQTGVYASLILKDLNGLNIEAGGRFNSFNKYGNVATFSFNPSYLVMEKVKLFTNLSSGFKAPTLYQLFSPYRNPYTDLKPEKSLSFDAGVQYIKDQTDVKAVYFARRTRDNIIFYTEMPSYKSYYINADEQNDQGVEVEANTSFDKWHLSFNYTNVTGNVKTKVNGKDTTFNNLFRRPQNVVNLNIGLDVTKSFYASFGIRSVSKYFEPVFSGSPIEMPSYYTWNAYAEYKFVKQVKAFVDLKNLTDEQYFEIKGYNSRRFNFMAGVHINL